jgi:hypothetical protein
MPEKSNKLPIFSRELCSEEFYTVFSGGSTSISVTCQACGREHFSSDGDHEKGELEKLLKKSEENPDAYVHAADDYISYFHFNGKQIVFDCPCNYARVIENMLRVHEVSIISFYDAITKKRFDTARERRAVVEALIEERKD